MKGTMIAGLAVLTCSASGSHAQAVLYQLEPDSTYVREQCLPPCACPQNTVTGPMRGVFRLALISQGGVFDLYRVFDFQFRTQLNTLALRGQGEGVYRYSLPAQQHSMQLGVTLSDLIVPVIREFNSGIAAVEPGQGLPTIKITLPSPQFGCLRDTIRLVARPVACEANCDGSTSGPALTPADFVCFLTRYRDGDAYTNCDASTTGPVLTPADFVCFLQKFRAGC